MPLFRVLRAALSVAQAQQRRQNRFCNIEPSLVTDSSEASKDGREASDGRSDVGAAWSATARAVPERASSRARAAGQPQEVARISND